MKIKKSKIVVPALGLLLLSTAASVTGSVAWFTANKTYTMTAGNFAVINTKDNLECVLAAGAGTSADNSTNTISNKTDYVLTDASFDHTDANIPVIVPDENGERIANKLGLAAEAATIGSALADGASGAANTDYVTKGSSAAAGFLSTGTNALVYAGTGTSFESDEDDKYFALTNIGANAIGADAAAQETSLLRDAASHAYSAMTWTMTFKISFSASSNANVGLFLDLSSDDTWVHRVITLEEDHEITAAEAAIIYSNPACSGDPAFTSGHTITSGEAALTYYAAMPLDTGLGFRMAFVPTAVDPNCYGITKVWAENQTSGNTTFVDESKGLVLRNGSTVYSTAYGTATTVNDGSGLAEADLSAAKVLMASGDNTVVPSASLTHATAESTNTNYLGYFRKNPGNTVSMTYTVYVWYEGTDENIVNTASTIYETVTTSMKFGTAPISTNQDGTAA